MPDSAGPTQAAASPALNDYLELTKPRLTAMALATTGVGFILANQTPSGWLTLLSVLTGAGMLGAGANALNQFIEKDTDSRMRRTEHRPLPSGRLTDREALIFSLTLSAAGLLALALWTDRVTASLGAATLLSYVLIYTPAKRFSFLNTFAGAVPGALPIVLGWTAGGGRLDQRAAILFLILFIWQLPHFFSIAWHYRDDYSRAGLRMITSEDTDPGRIAWRILIFCLILTAASWLPFQAGMAGPYYLAAAMTAGVTFSAMAARLIVRRMAGARPFILTSILYLGVVIFALLVDKR